ncbi:PIN domain-containing protein [Nakamurella silvestris]|nr:PIN domain-containing protein [Nakamurella silvestris]
MRVVADANVLYSRTLRDWLFLLLLDTGGHLFTVHYTEDILAETIARIREKNVDLDGAAMTTLCDRIRASMTSRIDDYPALPDSPLADKKDRHVHAAASAAGVQMLITQDKGFLTLPDEITDELTYEILTPDAFFVQVDDWVPDMVRAITEKQHLYWTGRSVTNLATALKSAGCPDFGERVAEHLRVLFC